MHAALDEVVDIPGGQVLGESSVDGGFRTPMPAVDAGLEELQWQSHDGDWPGQLMDEYGELRAEESSDGKVWLHSLHGPRSARREDLALRFAYGSTSDDRGLEQIDRSQRSTLGCCGAPYFERRALMAVARAVAATDHQQLILITVEGRYLQR